MERIHVDVRIPPEVEEYEKVQLTRLTQSPFIQDYLQNNGLTQHDLQQNIPFFLQLVEEVKECKQCLGLAHCVKKERGYVPMLKKIGFVQWVKTPCRYLKEEWQEKEKKQYYKYRQLSPESLAISFSSVNPTMETKEYGALLSQIVKWAHAPLGKGFYLHGAPGVGKTYLMLCLLNHFASEKKSVAFVNVLELISSNKPRIDFDVLYEIMQADFVVMDDIGAESVTALSRDDILFAILDARMNQRKATCFTSNFSMKDLDSHFTKNQYGDEEPVKAMRIMERIKALSVEVEMHGKSRR